MPFLLPILPAVAGGLASAAGGALISGIAGGAQSKPQNSQVPIANPLASGQPSAETLQQQQGLISALQGNGAVAQQGSNIQQQQALAGQLGQLAAGQGPNPALAQLAQTTGQNVAQQAALAAGQRGAGANAGLIARTAADAGAGAQQQAAGQAATLRAQQQLAGINALQSQQGLQAQTAQAQSQQQQAALQGLSAQQIQAIQEYNQQQLQQQQGINNIQAQQGQQQAGLIGQLGTGAVSGISSGLAGALTPSAGSTGSAASQSGSSIAGNSAAAYNALPNYADGGPVFANSSNQSANLKENYKGKSKVGAHLFAHGGKVPALVSPGERYLPPKEAKAVMEGKKAPMEAGEHILGKPKVGGARNSYANDTVKKTLTEGGIVLPRSVTQAPDKDEKAKKFIAAIKAKRK